MPITLKSVYADPEPADGLRLLVDRLWPRGMSRERLRLDGWLKELAPSDTLRRWFGHDPEKWEEFRRRYFIELEGHGDAILALLDKAGQGQVTLLFAAREQCRNNAAALRDYLERERRRAETRPAQTGKESS